MYTVDFSEIRMADVARLGGKNASLQNCWLSWPLDCFRTATGY